MKSNKIQNKKVNKNKYEYLTEMIIPIHMRKEVKCSY